jgi:tripartite-type tricarboxylate transporter receptor subunit TctC
MEERIMSRTARKIVTGVGAMTVALGISVGASAQTYPTQRITFIVGFAAGGFTDVVARAVGEHVSKKLGQPVVVENRGGAASNIAARLVAGAKPDGYTVLVSTTALAINATAHKKIDYSLLDDLVPVAIAVRAPETFGAKPGGATTLKDFIDQAKSSGGANFGSAGAGTGSHLTWSASSNRMPTSMSSTCRSRVRRPRSRPCSAVRSMRWPRRRQARSWPSLPRAAR